ncbi:MAG: hypothetical protein GY862_10965 [Gammaproteobacteria bacterium]|nr:hypothetical protein [Gammaproteobacteria bacterium]
MHTLTYALELQADRIVNIRLPEDVPLGKYQLMLVTEGAARYDDWRKNEDFLWCQDEKCDELMRQTSDLWQLENGF